MADSFSDVSSFNDVIDQGSEILNYDVREAIKDEQKISFDLGLAPNGEAIRRDKELQLQTLLREEDQRQAAECGIHGRPRT